VKERADVNNALAAHSITVLYVSPTYPLTPIGEMISRIQYGSSSRASSEPVGLPMIRMNNLQDDGWDLRDLKYIELPPKEAANYLLDEGDLLFNRTNSKELVGKCAVFREPGEWVFASYLIRVTLNPAKALPDFVSDFLGTKAGRAQIDRVSRQIAGMTNVNAEEIKALQVPLPPPDIQRQLVAEMQAARAARQTALAQADALLSGLDEYLLNELGLTKPQENTRKIYAVRLKAAKRRFDCDFHSPKFHNLRMSIENSPFPVVTVGEICVSIESGFAAGRDDQSTADEKGIPHIRPMNITPNGEFTLEGTKYVPHEGLQPRDFLSANEVLFNNTNSMQWVGKTAIFEGGMSCACSNHITRLVLREGQAEPHFVALLFNMLRSVGLFGLLSTNFNNQAGINTETLESLRIPLPPLDVQRQIQQELVGRQQKAREICTQAAADWEAAKAHFERQLLGEVPIE